VRKKTARKKVARKKAPPKKTARKAAGRRQAPVRQRAPAPATPAPSVAPAPPPAIAPEPSTSITASVPERIGVISHYYGHANAGIIEIEAGELRVGDTLHFRGHTTDFYQRVERIEVDHQPVESAVAGQVVGVQVSQRVREGDEVSRVSQ
jgi:putative protease